MTTFSVGSIGSSTSKPSMGQSFTPNVAGPSGSGTPGQATGVRLTAISVGFPSSNVSLRPTECIVFSEPLQDPDFASEAEGAVVRSNGTVDESCFGTGTYARRFTFPENTLDPETTYYAYFNSAVTIRANDPGSYSYPGGAMLDDYGEASEQTAQFKAEFSC